MAGALTLIREDGTSFSFDGEESLGFSPEAIITQFPIENGAEVSDHSYKRNNPIRARGLTTKSPLPIPGESFSPRRTQEAVEFLESILGERITLVVTHPVYNRTFSPVALSRMPFELTTLNEIGFDVEFRVVQVAEAQLVFIPREQPPPATATASGDKQASFPDEVDVGEQPLRKEVTAQEQEQANQSFAAKGLDYLFG